MEEQEESERRTGSSRERQPRTADDERQSLSGTKRGHAFPQFNKNGTPYLFLAFVRFLGYPLSATSLIVTQMRKKKSSLHKSDASSSARSSAKRSNRESFKSVNRQDVEQRNERRKEQLPSVGRFRTFRPSRSPSTISRGGLDYATADDKENSIAREPVYSQTPAASGPTSLAGPPVVIIQHNNPWLTNPIHPTGKRHLGFASARS